ncbi:MAG TPA: phage Gp37/Gp68 family protein [Gammaproteobacteria bacterium]|nr:phage Gp37/Gp68 family protein [Gammaproteobacteria bacterium]
MGEHRRSTAIEWTEHTWNPFVGCSVHSAGCTNCYAMRLAARIDAFGTTLAYTGTTRMANGNSVWTGRINRASPATWRKPLGVRAPSMFFVNSMSDFFHAAAPDAWRLDALDVMRATPRHQYQVLTKRPENVGPFLARTGVKLPANVWLGATVERGDVVHRVDVLRAVPAGIRFLSLEPLLGPLGGLDLGGIQWVIIGGESGPGARPMRVEWVREIIEQCVAADVAVFFKQWGKPTNNPIACESTDERSQHTGARRVAELDPHGKGGALVDGVLWREFPCGAVRIASAGPPA